MIPPERLTPELRARLARQVARVCPHWMRDHQDDFVQMALVKLMRSDAESELGDTFLRRVAYTVVVDEMRRRRRRDEVGMSPSLPDRLMNTRDELPETRVRGQQIGDVLLQCLATLAEDRRRAVTLYLQDHAIPEIGVLLGCDTKRASNLVYRGLEDLREALRERAVVP